MKQCTQCGTQLPDGAAFCHVCGQAVSSPSVEVQPQTVAMAAAVPLSAVQQAVLQAAPAPAIQPATTDFCVKCGAKLAPEVGFCSNCGTPRKAIAEPIKISDALENRARNAMIIEIIGGICGLLGIGHLYSGNTQLGIILLIGWLVGSVILFGLAATGVGLCLALPLWLAVPVFSGIKARDYVRAQN